MQAPIIILDVNGVGYELWVPMSTYYNLPDIPVVQFLIIFNDAFLRFDLKYWCAVRFKIPNKPS